MLIELQKKDVDLSYWYNTLFVDQSINDSSKLLNNLDDNECSRYNERNFFLKLKIRFRQWF